MKTCRDCIHYEVCKQHNATYHTSRLTLESDVSERCYLFFEKTTIVKCKDCKYYAQHIDILGSVCTRLFTVFPMKPDDFCIYAERIKEE